MRIFIFFLDKLISLSEYCLKLTLPASSESNLTALRTENLELRAHLNAITAGVPVDAAPPPPSTTTTAPEKLQSGPAPGVLDPRILAADRAIQDTADLLSDLGALHQDQLRREGVYKYKSLSNSGVTPGALSPAGRKNGSNRGGKLSSLRSPGAYDLDREGALGAAQKVFRTVGDTMRDGTNLGESRAIFSPAIDVFSPGGSNMKNKRGSFYQQTASASSTDVWGRGGGGSPGAGAPHPARGRSGLGVEDTTNRIGAGPPTSRIAAGELNAVGGHSVLSEPAGGSGTSSSRFAPPERGPLSPSGNNLNTRRPSGGGPASPLGSFSPGRRMQVSPRTNLLISEQKRLLGAEVSSHELFRVEPEIAIPSQAEKRRQVRLGGGF